MILIFFNTCIPAQVTPFFSEQSLSPKKKYSVQYWTTENGLPQNSINDIQQTADGYIWLATYDGLVRFDGIVFKTFNTVNTPQLKTSGIRRLFVDENDVLWLITADGDLLSYKKNKFKAYKLPCQLDYIKNTITCFKGKVIITCLNNKLFWLKGDVFEKMPAPEFEWIYCLETVAGNTLYVGTRKGLWKYDGSGWYSLPEFSKTGMSRLYAAPSGELFVDAEYNLYSVVKEKVTPVEVPVSLKILYEYYLGFNESGQLTILSEMGLLIRKGDHYDRITTEDGLSSNSTRSMLVDKEKNIWVGTNNGGLNKLKPKVFSAYAQEDGMANDGITAIMQLQNGEIAFGNNCSGISILRNGAFLQPMMPPKANACVWSLMQDEEGKLWVGTYRGGIAVYQNGKEIRSYTHQHDSLLADIVLALYRDDKKITWVGTMDGLCTIEDDKAKTFDAGFHSKITQIIKDKKGTMWFCSDKGLFFAQDSKLIAFRPKGLKEGAVRYFYEDEEGTFWLGTHGNGLVRIKDNTAFYFVDHTSQFDKNVWSIAEDKEHNLWMPSNAGMYVINKKALTLFAEDKTQSLNPVYFGKEDGLKSIEFNGGFQPAFVQTKGGLWFPSIKGAAFIDPSIINTTKKFTPKLVIEKLALHDSLLNVSDTLHVQEAAQNLSIGFTAPSFINPGRLNFQYKIDGLDNAWNELGTLRELKLNNIPEGMHVLKLRILGYVNSEIRLVINKPIPLWKQPRFVIGCICAFFVLMVGATVFIIGLVRKREQRKTQLSKQYASIELKALQAQLNPHFIFNCLNSIHHFIIANDELSASKYMSKFSQLMRMFLEHSKSNHISLQQECDLLSLYIEIESLRFKNGFNFKLDLEPGLDAFNIQIPSMLLQPFVENSIKHGLLNLERKGSLLVSFRVKDSELICIIDDNGVGMEKARELQSKLHDKHTSRGMELIRDRINAINHAENTNITLSIINKAINDGENGTRVIVQIPI